MEGKKRELENGIRVKNLNIIYGALAIKVMRQVSINMHNDYVQLLTISHGQSYQLILVKLIFINHDFVLLYHYVVVTNNKLNTSSLLLTHQRRLGT